MPTRTTKVKMTYNAEFWQGCGAIRALMYWWWKCKMAQPPYKITWYYFTMLNIHLSYDSAIVLWGIYPRDIKTYVCTQVCTQLFSAALFITTQTWKQPKGSTGEWTHCGATIPQINTYITMNETVIKHRLISETSR